MRDLCVRKFVTCGEINVRGGVSGTSPLSYVAKWSPLLHIQAARFGEYVEFRNGAKALRLCDRDAREFLPFALDYLAGKLRVICSDPVGLDLGASPPILDTGIIDKSFLSEQSIDNTLGDFLSEELQSGDDSATARISRVLNVGDWAARGPSSAPEPVERDIGSFREFG